MTEANEQILPAIRYINGHAYIKIQDLANYWHTTTSTILATGKPHQVPAQYRKTIDGCTWCDVDGLRYRLNTMKTGSNLAVQLKDLVDRFPKDETHVDESLGPQVETIHTKDGSTCTISRSFIQRIDYPSQEEIQIALANRQVLWQYENKRVQVLAQTLSSFLNTRTSSLLAVNKKHGVPEKFIHREWKQTWVDLEGLKKRVEQTGHSSDLLKGLKQVIEILNDYETALSRPLTLHTSKPCASGTQESASARAILSSVEQKKQAKPKAKRGTKHNPIDVCEVAVEANKRAVHNTERINDLSQKMRNHEVRAERTVFNLAADTHNVSIRVDDLQQAVDNLKKQDKSVAHVANERAKDNADRLLELETRVNTMEAGDWKEKGKSVSLSVDELEARIVDLEDKHENLENLTRDDWKKANDKHDHLGDRVWHLEEWRKCVDKQATENTVNQTLLGDLNTRVGRLATQADRLDTKTEGLVSRVSVLEDTSKWLSWTLAGVIGVRFIRLMLRLLKRK